MRPRSFPGTRISRSARHTTTPLRFARKKRPDTTRGSRAGYSGTRRATTRSQLWSRDLSWSLAASLAARFHPIPHLFQIAVKDFLLVGGKYRADVSGLLLLQIHHFGHGSLVRRATGGLSRFAKLHLLRHVLLADGLDLILLCVRQGDVLEEHSAHSTATAHFALTLWLGLSLCSGNRCKASAEGKSQRGDANTLHPSLLENFVFDGTRRPAANTPKVRKRLNSA